MKESGRGSSQTLNETTWTADITDLQAADGSRKPSRHLANRTEITYNRLAGWTST